MGYSIAQLGFAYAAVPSLPPISRWQRSLRRIANIPARGLPSRFLTKVDRAGHDCGILLTDLVDAVI